MAERNFLKLVMLSLWLPWNTTYFIFIRMKKKLWRPQQKATKILCCHHGELVWKQYSRWQCRLCYLMPIFFSLFLNDYTNCACYFLFMEIRHALELWYAWFPYLEPTKHKNISKLDNTIVIAATPLQYGRFNKFFFCKVEDTKLQCQSNNFCFLYTSLYTPELTELCRLQRMNKYKLRPQDCSAPAIHLCKTVVLGALRCNHEYFFAYSVNIMHING